MHLYKNVLMDTLYRRKWFIIFILSVYRRLDPVEGLKCYCNSQSESCPNETCETDGFCFASTSRRDGRQHYTFHCIERRSLIPIEHPFTCSTTRSKNESVVIECCDNEDMCNRKLRLELPPPEPGNPAPAPAAALAHLRCMAHCFLLFLMLLKFP
ncbi:unnamed protein product [Plutella xylostella]|uniref:(diamondback moth) hypothetical protein n=1 Tax=Plutella xylostella TaxID=51655 RepID=A0A8S4GDS7_PLUXY|nr:unnamed protein product [Plutella xylostella]